jgi:hypothetical protein
MPFPAVSLWFESDDIINKTRLASHIPYHYGFRGRGTVQLPPQAEVHW